MSKCRFLAHFLPQHVGMELGLERVTEQRFAFLTAALGNSCLWSLRTIFLGHLKALGDGLTFIMQVIFLLLSKFNTTPP